MISQSETAGEIGLRLAAIAVLPGSARERDAALMRLLRERLGAVFLACYKRSARAGRAPTIRARASDEGVPSIHPTLAHAARPMAGEWLATGVAGHCILDDPRFAGWQMAGCLPGGARAGLVVVAVWPPDVDATPGAATLTALAPLLLLALRGDAGRSRRAKGRDARVDDAKAGFVSLVSHALRTPLNTLTGFVEIVLDQPVGPLNERQREFLSYARLSGQELTALVEDVMLLSRAEEGSLTLRCERLDAAMIVERAFERVRASADQKHLRLSWRAANDSPSIVGDGARLTHALAKLLENAVKFSPEGGEVALAVTTRDGMVYIAVRDEGAGVAPEDTSRIFARFYQPERTAKAHPGGYGLGLALAQVIAEAHGGSIQVESAPGQGATFTLSAPASVALAGQRVATKIRRGASGAASRPS
jgi:signal transduction histidine kinase